MKYELKNDRVRFVIDTIGATFLALTIDGENVLQNCEDKTNVPKDETAGFPLLPIANRVQSNQYELGNEKVTLALTSADKSEYLHGVGWIDEWQLESISDAKDSLVLVLHSEGEVEQDYVFTARLHISLKDTGIETLLSIEHEGQNPRLYGLGFHPYFAIEQNDELLVNALAYCKEKEGHMMEEPSENIPKQFDYRNFHKISDEFVNHSYVGCNGIVLKHVQTGSSFKMTSSATNLMMYHQPKHNFIALEPQTHLVNGANMQGQGRGGMVLLDDMFSSTSLSMEIYKIS